MYRGLIRSKGTRAGRIVLATVWLALAVVGCSQAPPTKPVQAATEAKEPPQWLEVELYVNHHIMTQPSGVTFKPNLAESGEIVTFSASTGLEGQGTYTAKMTYLGRGEGGDRYEVTVTYPPDNTPEGMTESITRQFTYRGQDEEVWRDHQYRVGLRPLTEGPGPKAAPPEES